MPNTPFNEERGQPITLDCPPASSLKDFMQGRLANRHFEEISRHLESCQKCELNIRGLGNDSLLEKRLRQALLQEYGSASDTEPTVQLDTGFRSNDPPPAIPAADETITLPKKIGKYEILGVAGKGGFGMVFKAYDAKLDKFFAIKVPLVDKFGSDKAYQSFIDEARVTARLEHPNIVTIHSVEEDAIGQVYIVMQWIDGKSLREIIQKSGCLTLSETCRIVSALSRAVHHAHKQGFIHRDLKPANILIRADGEPFVMDFGMAVHDRDKHLLRGEIAGTRAYMAPEQFRGDVHKMDGRADIFAIGVILYECLVGKRPFETDSATALNADSVSVKPLRQSDESIPQPVEDCCLKCLEVDPAKRFSSAYDVHLCLTAQLDESKKHGTLEISATGSSQVSKSKPVLIAVALLSLVGLLLFVAGSFFLQGPRDGSGERPDFEPGRNYRLLDYKPEKLVWEPTAFSDKDKDLERISVHSPGKGLLKYGDVDFDNFSLEVDLEQVAWTGGLGLFLGLQETSDGFACQVFNLHIRKDLKLGQEFFGIERCLYREVQGQPQISQLANAEIPHPGPRPGKLKIEVRDGQVAFVKWSDQIPLDLALPDFLRQDLAEAGELDQATNTRGSFGVYVEGASCTFSDFRLNVSEVQQR